VDFASFYLEQGRDEEDAEDKPPEGWYACVQFTLVLWNPQDPSVHVVHSKNLGNHGWAAFWLMDPSRESQVQY